MNKKGFTLIELLIVIGIIAILASGVIVAINPGRQFAQARDATRESHIKTLYNALISYQVSNQGNLSDLPITSTPTEICNTNEIDPGSCGSLVDLSTLTIDGYINSLPVDPQGGVDANGTGYFVSEGSIILVADKAETRFISVGITEEEYSSSGGFPCGDDFTDSRNGEIYSTLEIGNQCWIARNMNYDDGCSEVSWLDGSDEGWCGYHTSASGEEYGLLYQWSAAMNNSTIEGSQGICPDGWHLPSNQEYTDFQNYIDSNFDGYVGDQIKDPSANWCYGTPCGETGWNGLPGGRRSGSNGWFYAEGGSGYWLTSTESSSTSVYIREASSGNSAMFNPTRSKSDARYVRCLKN